MGGSLPTEQKYIWLLLDKVSFKAEVSLLFKFWWMKTKMVSADCCPYIYIPHARICVKNVEKHVLGNPEKMQIWQASGFNMFQLWPLASDIEWDSIWIDSTENYLSLFISIYLLSLSSYQCPDSWRSLVGPCRRLPGVQGHHPERCCAFLRGQSLRTWAAGLVMVFGEKERLSLAISSPKAAPFSGAQVINTYPDHCHVTSMDFGYFGPVPLWVE